MDELSGAPLVGVISGVTLSGLSLMVGYVLWSVSYSRRMGR